MRVKILAYNEYMHICENISLSIVIKSFIKCVES